MSKIAEIGLIRQTGVGRDHDGEEAGGLDFFIFDL
jgi:hypothetical protein